MKQYTKRTAMFERVAVMAIWVLLLCAGAYVVYEMAHYGN